MEERKPLNKLEKKVLSECKEGKNGKRNIPKFLTIATHKSAKSIVDSIESIEQKGHARFNPISKKFKDRILKDLPKEGDHYKLTKAFKKRADVDAVHLERAIRELRTEGHSFLIDKKVHPHLLIDDLRDAIPVRHLDDFVEAERTFSDDSDIKEDIITVKQHLLGLKIKSRRNLEDLHILLRHPDKEEVKKIIDKYKEDAEKS